MTVTPVSSRNHDVSFANYESRSYEDDDSDQDSLRSSEKTVRHFAWYIDAGGLINAHTITLHTVVTCILSHTIAHAHTYGYDLPEMTRL